MSSASSLAWLFIAMVECEAAEARGRALKRAGEWLLKRDLAGSGRSGPRTGCCASTSPASVFGGDRSKGRSVLSLSELGTFVVLDCDFFQVWRADEPV